MFLELIATFVAGFAAAGVVMTLNYLTGRRLPLWATPSAAGLGMIAMTIGLEYTWFDRTVSNLPDGLVVSEIAEVQQIYRPWTYAAPLVNQFSAVDVATMRAHPSQPDRKIADIFVMGRWRAVKSFPMMFDCTENKSALIGPNVSFSDEGDVSGVLWADVTADNSKLAAACRGEGLTHS